METLSAAKARQIGLLCEFMASEFASVGYVQNDGDFTDDELHRKFEAFKSRKDTP